MGNRDTELAEAVRQYRWLSHATDAALHDYPTFEAALRREAASYRQVAELAWNEHTIHPSEKYELNGPEGQCGVTILTFATWRAWLGRSEDMMAIQEGTLVHATDEGNKEYSDHVWLLADSFDGSADVDLTPSQFSSIDQPIIVQSSSDPNSPFSYRVEASTPYKDYDIAGLGPRFYNLLFQWVEIYRKLGDVALPSWPVPLPKDSANEHIYRKGNEQIMLTVVHSWLKSLKSAEEY